MTKYFFGDNAVLLGRSLRHITRKHQSQPAVAHLLRLDHGGSGRGRDRRLSLGKVPYGRIAPIHPGEVLMDEFLEPLGVSQHHVVISIGVPPRRINEIVHGKRRIPADTALRLARYFGTTDRSGSICRAASISKSRRTTSAMHWPAYARCCQLDRHNG